VERRDIDATYNPMTVEALAADAPGFPWRAYFDAIGAKGLARVNVSQPAYFRAFAKFASQRRPAEWQAYLRFQLVNDAAPALPKRFEEAHYAFHSGVLKGVKSAPPRERHVLSFISGNYGSEPMALAIGMVFVDRAFPPEAKARSDALIRNVKAALAERIRALDWMGAETKVAAQGKLDAMAVKIGYPDRWRDYTAATVGRVPFAENWIRAGRFDIARQVAQLGTPVDRTSWSMSPHIVNAFYNARANEIVFPAGILQAPFFDRGLDDPINFGAIGAVIGHEYTHGFDDQGSKFDPEGNLQNWWTPDDLKAFQERTDCIAKEYEGFVTVKDATNGDVHLNGRLTLGENTADNGGLRVAYRALMKTPAGKEAKLIDGFTPVQRFFLGFANIYCQNATEQVSRQLAQTDPHSPGEFRLIGSIGNMEEFREAFGCKAGQPMVRENVCRAW
jgi:predicted metalloendopeptidase